MEETLIWKGSSSPWINLGRFILCFVFAVSLLYLELHIGWLLLPFLLSIYFYLRVRCVTYEITSERIIIHKGIFSRRTDYIEFYRLRDTNIVQPFFLRLVSLSNLVFLTSDRLTVSFQIPAISNARKVREEIRYAVEKIRVMKDVRVREY